MYEFPSGPPARATYFSNFPVAAGKFPSGKDLPQSWGVSDWAEGTKGRAGAGAPRPGSPSRLL